MFLLQQAVAVLVERMFDAVFRCGLDAAKSSGNESDWEKFQVPNGKSTDKISTTAHFLGSVLSFPDI
jgi:hypothetical protein